MAKRTAAAIEGIGPLPALLPVEEVQQRLERLFPEAFADRNLLVGDMAARVVFVFLYGGFVQGRAAYLRPSHIYLFTEDQSWKTTDTDRLDWLRQSRPGYRPPGSRWYSSDNSREMIRDDLMRNQFRRLGISQRLPGHPVTSSKPIHFLSLDFVELFSPELCGDALDAALASWRRNHLSPGELSRMALRAEGAISRSGDVFIELPDGTRTRIAAGPSSVIAKGLIEDFAKRHLREPLVLWLSSSDEKVKPEFQRFAATVGLKFDVKQELPDLILADLHAPSRFVFCEIVATDGPITEVRKKAFLDIASSSGLAREQIEFLTAFEDRKSPAFRKTFSQIAAGSMIWFRCEPQLVVTIAASEFQSAG